MKKSIFKVGFLTTLVLILMVSCTSPAEETPAKLPAVSNKQKVANSSTLPDVYDVYDIPAYIGALHNASIYAFVDYVHENNLSPFEVGGFTDGMIDTFAYNFVESNLLPVLENFEPTIEVSTIILDALEDEIMFAYDSVNGVDEINYEIQERVDYLYEVFAIEGDGVLVYDAIKEIAIATNMLWGRNWDFTTPIFEIPDYASDNDNEGEENNDEKSEEEMRELKKADITGAVSGAWNGAEWGAEIAGPMGAVWGAIIGASAGAVVASIVEYVAQEVVECATCMSVEYINQDTYLYNYLLTLHHTNPSKYYALFGDKFDAVIY